MKNSAEADDEVNGIPGQFRQRANSRVEALAYYTYRYNLGDVDKCYEYNGHNGPSASAASSPVAAGSSSQA